MKLLPWLSKKWSVVDDPNASATDHKSNLEDILREEREVHFTVSCHRREGFATDYLADYSSFAGKAKLISKAAFSLSKSSGGGGDVHSANFDAEMSDPHGIGWGCPCCGNNEVVVCDNCGHRTCGTEFTPWKCGGCGKNTNRLELVPVETLEVREDETPLRIEEDVAATGTSLVVSGSTALKTSD